MIDLSSKKYVVFGVANKASICWAITEKLLAAKAEVILVSLPMMIERPAFKKLIADNSGIIGVLPCDVSSDSDLDACFADLKNLGPFDGVVHGIAFSDKNELRGSFLATTRANFKTTMEVSCFSFIDITNRIAPLLNNGASIITLTFDAAHGVYPNYNIMGPAKAALEASVRYAAVALGEREIRVNSLSPSPERTLSAGGIGDFLLIGEFAEAMSAYGRRATFEEIGNVGLFYLSPLSSGISGQNAKIDCGSSASIMPPARHAGKMAKAMLAIVQSLTNKMLGGSNASPN